MSIEHIHSEYWETLFSCLLCEEKGVESLLNLTIKNILTKNIIAITEHILDQRINEDPINILRPNIILPECICNKLFENIIELCDKKLISKYFSIFGTNSTNLTIAQIHNSAITDKTLIKILNHKLDELELVNCQKLTKYIWYFLNSNNPIRESLHKLTIRKCEKLTREYVEDDNYEIPSNLPFQLNLTNLQHLEVNNFQPKDPFTFWKNIFNQITNLNYLNLSNCLSLGTMEFLLNMKQLCTLILYNCTNINEAWPNICKVTTLKYLDISQFKVGSHYENLPQYDHEDDKLNQLIHCLPSLESLDISGTNLAGRGVFTSIENIEGVDVVMSDILGLNARITRPLEFLGLYEAKYSPCMRHHIPAKMIAGDANEKQLLISANMYMERVEMMEKILSDLFIVIRANSKSEHLGHALFVTLRAMDLYPKQMYIQISGTCALYYMIEGKVQFLSVRIKQHILNTLLNAMKTYNYNESIIRNGLLIIANFRISQDIISVYDRLVKILLEACKGLSYEDNTVRIAVYLLNSLACQGDQQQKIKLGKLKLIEYLLNTIEQLVNMKRCDEVMEVAWSTLWNVTDECDINCQKFLDLGGMEKFLDCLEAFPNREEMVRNMMGLLGNIAEVKSQRSRLMNETYIEVFVKLLTSKNDVFEISYNAAGVLSHLVSDGINAWTIKRPDRNLVLKFMRIAIKDWPIHSARDMNYNSLKPILNLLNQNETPECHLWACWAFANLTTIDPEKYLKLLDKEHGFLKLYQLLRMHEATINQKRRDEKRSKNSGGGYERGLGVLKAIVNLVRLVFWNFIEHTKQKSATILVCAESKILISLDQIFNQTNFIRPPINRIFTEMIEDDTE